MSHGFNAHGYSCTLIASSSIKLAIIEVEFPTTVIRAFGAALKKMGRGEKAIADIDIVIRLNLKEAFAYFNQGDAYMKKRGYDLARASLTLYLTFLKRVHIRLPA